MNLRGVSALQRIIHLWKNLLYTANVSKIDYVTVLPFCPKTQISVQSAESNTQSGCVYWHCQLRSSVWKDALFKTLELEKLVRSRHVLLISSEICSPDKNIRKWKVWNKRLLRHRLQGSATWRQRVKKIVPRDVRGWTKKECYVTSSREIKYVRSSFF